MRNDYDEGRFNAADDIRWCGLSYAERLAYGGQGSRSDDYRRGYRAMIEQVRRKVTETRRIYTAR